jgi:hypothetical protein
LSPCGTRLHSTCASSWNNIMFKYTPSTQAVLHSQSHNTGAHQRSTRSFAADAFVFAFRPCCWASAGASRLRTALALAHMLSRLLACLLASPVHLSLPRLHSRLSHAASLARHSLSHASFPSPSPSPPLFSAGSCRCSSPSCFAAPPS